MHPSDAAELHFETRAGGPDECGVLPACAGSRQDTRVPDESLVAFDAFPPRQYVGATAYRKDYADFFAAFPGPAKSQASDVYVETSGPLGYARGFDRWVITGKDGKPLEVVFRFHEHLSVPVDPVTGQADFLSKP